MGKKHIINRRKFLGFIGCSCGGYILNGCGTVPITERKQFTIYPESMINNQAAKAYEKLKNSKKIKLIEKGKDINNIIDACSKIIEESGKLLKTEKWGLLNLSKKIKNNRKGVFVHFKFESDGEVVNKIKKKLSVENKIIRHLTVKYKKLDLKKNYFEENKKDYEKR